MKRLSFLTILLVLLASGMNAQVQRQATVAWISSTNPAADPYLCVFGNSIEDVRLIESDLDLDGKDVLFLRQRERATPDQNFTREMERLNAKFMCIYIVQRRYVGEPKIFEHYFIAVLVERVGNVYYEIGGNNY
jgi:hypothetical protein